MLCLRRALRQRRFKGQVGIADASNKDLYQILVFDAVAVLLKGGETLLGILQMGLVKAANAVAKLLVAKVWVDFKAVINGRLTHFFHQDIVETLLDAVVALNGGNFVVANHVVVQDLFASWVFAPKESIRQHGTRQVGRFGGLGRRKLFELGSTLLLSLHGHL